MYWTMIFTLKIHCKLFLFKGSGNPFYSKNALDNDFYYKNALVNDFYYLKTMEMIFTLKMHLTMIFTIKMHWSMHFYYLKTMEMIFTLKMHLTMIFTVKMHWSNDFYYLKTSGNDFYPKNAFDHDFYCNKYLLEIIFKKIHWYYYIKDHGASWFIHNVNVRMHLKSNGNSFTGWNVSNQNCIGFND